MLLSTTETIIMYSVENVTYDTVILESWIIQAPISNYYQLFNLTESTDDFELLYKQLIIIIVIYYIYIYRYVLKISTSVKFYFPLWLQVSADVSRLFWVEYEEYFSRTYLCAIQWKVSFIHTFNNYLLIKNSIT